MLTESEYVRERAIVDTAAAYWNRVAPNRTYLTAEEAAHPDYAACGNAMRGRVEQYEILTDPPERFTAYVSSDGLKLTTWTGGYLGRATLGHGWTWPPGYGARLHQIYAYVVGADGVRREYTGRGQGAGMYVNLRETAESRRKRATKET